MEREAEREVGGTRRGSRGCVGRREMHQQKERGDREKKRERKIEYESERDVDRQMEKEV